VQQRQAATCGSISAFTSLRTEPDDSQLTRGFIALSAKALNRHYGAMNSLMLDTLNQVRFDEHNRIRELIGQHRAHREHAVTGSGHQLAVMAAAASISPLAGYNHRNRGIAGIQALKQLDQRLDQPGEIAVLAQQLESLHQRLTSTPLQLLNVCEGSQRAEFNKLLTAALPAAAAGEAQAITLQTPDAGRHQLWYTNTQVNFCAKAWPTVPMAHPDAPVLSVLGGLLRNGYLHSAIREQGGAYGAGASQDSNIGVFVMYSYRDPRLLATLEDFDASIQWLLLQDHARETVEEAILGVIGSLDKPASPAGEAKQHFHARLLGRSDALRDQFRQRVLEVSAADLQRVAHTWLRPEAANSAIITAPSSAETLAGWVEQNAVAVEKL
jgi:Zn-dependent M16 (insulinase) family peptidase